MALLFDSGVFSVIGEASEILVGAKLYWYVANTSTPATTYTSPGLGVENTNPVVADADGRFPQMWLGAGSYKYILTAADSTPSDPLVTVDDFAVAAAIPDIDPALYDFLAGTDPLPVANGGTNATSAVNAAAELEVLALAGGELTGEITQDGAGAYLYNGAAGQVSGAVFVTVDSDPDPTSAAGEWWAKYE